MSAMFVTLGESVKVAEGIDKWLDSHHVADIHDIIGVI